MIFFLNQIYFILIQNQENKRRSEVIQPSKNQVKHKKRDKELHHQSNYVISKSLTIPTSKNYHVNNIIYYIFIIYIDFKILVIPVSPNAINSLCNNQLQDRSPPTLTLTTRNNPNQLFPPLLRIMVHLDPLKDFQPNGFKLTASIEETIQGLFMRADATIIHFNQTKSTKPTFYRESPMTSQP